MGNSHEGCVRAGLSLIAWTAQVGIGCPWKICLDWPGARPLATAVASAAVEPDFTSAEAPEQSEGDDLLTATHGLEVLPEVQIWAAGALPPLLLAALAHGFRDESNYWKTVTEDGYQGEYSSHYIAAVPSGADGLAWPPGRTAIHQAVAMLAALLPAVVQSSLAGAEWWAHKRPHDLRRHSDARGAAGRGWCYYSRPSSTVIAVIHGNSLYNHVYIKAR